MAIPIVMPRLGWNMEEGTLVEWLKQPGADVQAGDLLFTVESDKALNEVESFDGGVLHIPDSAPGPGKTVAIGTVLGYLLQPGEKQPAEMSTPPQPDPLRPSTPPPVQSTPPPTGTATKAAGSAKARPSISPRARRLAMQLGVDWESLIGTGRDGRITEDDVRAAGPDD
ncbi:MAG: E3 binding domain-containing protein [Candidatus Latescibacterota bacterium]|nr:E3 binding domain-containing protein [Candidatus Latescibacterota bacterium]